jgi:Bacterial aa3 type cytochrome c oxidase subunit IV
MATAEHAWRRAARGVMTARQKYARNGAIPLPWAGNYAKSAAPGATVGDDGMADHGEVEYATAEGNDYAAHEQTYENFIKLVKVVMTIVVIILVGMAYFLT